MKLKEAIRLRVQKLCDENGITLNALSYRCGITQSTLNSIVSGRNSTTTVSTVKKICDGLDMTLVDFFDDPVFLDVEQEVK